jgi:exonuclease III
MSNVPNTQTSSMRFCVVYRPPASKNNMQISVFFEELSKYINQHVIAPEELLITGDLNFHLDKPTDPSTQKFMSLLHEHGLTQHVNEPTHAHGHNYSRCCHHQGLQNHLTIISSHR